MRDLLQIALAYHESGYHVTPINQRKDTEKVKYDFPRKWQKYQTEQSEQEVRELFAQKCSGIAIVITKGMEVIDIDTKADPTGKIADQYFEELVFTGQNELLKKVVKVQTKSNGFHLIYKAPNCEGNQKLATRKNCTEAAIETRGFGGLIYACPTPGYKVLNGSLSQVPELTAAERNTLINAAIGLDESKDTEAPEIVAPKEFPTGNITPWDDYKAKTDLLGLLESYNWKFVRDRGGDVILSKPGASDPKDTDAKIIKASNGDPIFHPFTTGTAFESRRNYNAFQVYALMEHGGDGSEAAKQLLREGFGTPVEVIKEQEGKEELSELLAFVKSTRFDINKPVIEEEAILTVTLEGKTYKVGGKGQLGVITGAQKSGKSLITSCITSAGLSGKRGLLPFDLDVNGYIDYYDTEQSKFFYGLTQQRIYKMGGLINNHPKYAAYHLRRLAKKDRLNAIDLMLKGRTDLSCIVIDGAVDLCEDFNDVKASERIADKLLQWSDETGGLLLTILHTTKQMNFMRGHLGTALQNKADFAIETIQDKDAGVYTVKCRESRFAPFPSFEFTRDEDGMPVYENGMPEPEGDSWPEPEQPNQEYQTIIPPPEKVDDQTVIPF